MAPVLLDAFKVSGITMCFLKEWRKIYSKELCDL
jgi:hypothetical protein